jgi:hypothetical protein
VASGEGEVVGRFDPIAVTAIDAQLGLSDHC